MLSIWCIEVTSCVIVNVVSGRLYVIFSPPETMSPVDLPWHEAPRLCLDVSKLMNYVGGLAKICYCIGLGFLSTTAVLFSWGLKASHFLPRNCAWSFPEYVDVEETGIEEVLEVQPLLWRIVYLSVCSILTVIVSWSKISLHCVCSFSTFSLGRLNVIFWEYISMPRNTKVDVGVEFNFFILMRKPRCYRKKIKVSPANSSSS